MSRAGRPPLPIGTWGSISFVPSRNGEGVRARTRYRGPSGRTQIVERTGRNRGAARNALTTYLSTLTADGTGDLTQNTRLSVALDWWLDTIKDKPANTQRQYEMICRLQLVPRMGDLLLRECSVSRIEHVLQQIRDDKSPSAARLSRVVLSGVFALVVRHDVLTHNPVKSTRSVKIERHEPLALPLDDLRRLRVGARRWERGLHLSPAAPTPIGRVKMIKAGYASDLGDIIDVMLATGARSGEVLALRWHDVDLDSGDIEISGKIVSEVGKPSARVDQRKSNGKSMTLQLPQFAIDVLRARRERTTLDNVHDAIFPSTEGNWRRVGSMSDAWRDLLDMLGIDKDTVKPKTLRSTVATLVARERGSAIAAEQLGHASDVVTRKHYIEPTRRGPDVRDLLSRAVDDVG